MAVFKVDCSTETCVVVCSACPHWSAFAWDREAGWDAAVRHERLVHPGGSVASTNRAALRNYRREKELKQTG